MRAKLYIINIIIMSLFAICNIAIGGNTPSECNLINHLSVDNGLLHDGITVVCEDKRGYLWIGTYDGLCQYSGTYINTYKNSLNNKIFNSNRVRSLNSDLNGNIWIGTEMGVTVYDYEYDKFINLDFKSIIQEGNECIIMKILPSPDKTEMFCLTQSDGVLVYDLEMNFKRIIRLGTENTYYDFAQIDDNLYLFASNNGLRYYNSKDDTQNIIFPDLFYNAKCICNLDDSSLLIGLEDGVKKLYFEKSSKDGEYDFRYNNEHFYQELNCHDIDIDNRGSLWIGSEFKGVSYVKDAVNKFGTNAQKIKENERISSVFITNDDCVWLGTFDSGLFLYNVGELFFNSFDLSPLGDNLHIYQILKYDEDRLLFRYDINKITFYNTKINRCEPVPFDLTEEDISSIGWMYIDKNKSLWLFQNIDNKKDICLRIDWGETKGKYFDVTDFNCDEFIYLSYVEEDIYGDLWLGFANDVSRILLDKNRDIINIESLNRNKDKTQTPISTIRRMYSDSITNSVWVGTRVNGLYQFKLGSRDEKLEDIKIRNFVNNPADKHSLPSNFVTFMGRANSGRMWIGTEQGGICEVINSENENTSFNVLSEVDGLSNDVVKNILFDKKDNLWISTNIGISHYVTCKNSFINYTKESGIPFNQFWYSGVNIDDDNLCFSGRKAICHFNPNILPRSSELPNVEFSSFKILNDKINVGIKRDGRVILDKRIGDNGIIKLKHYENVFTVNVDAICTQKFYSRNIKYRLTPNSKDWIIMPFNSKEINFNNLQPGNYTLEVAASNFFGEWTDISKLHINITPSFWKRWWAYLCYCLILLAIILLVFSILLRINRLKHNLQIEAMKKENLETMNREKLIYFSNISHEFKAPLTLIIAPIAMLAERFALDVDVKAKLKVVTHQINKLLNLINQVHELELKDSKLLYKSETTFSLNSAIGNIASGYIVMAQYDNKEFIVENCDKSILVKADRDMMEKILNNLLSNAFKHTRKGDKILFSIDVKDENVNIKVKDSGYGISLNDINHIFERFYQGKERGSANIGGTGIGLYFTKALVKLHDGTIGVNSIFGEGAEFNVVLPIITKNTDNEIIEEDIQNINIEQNFILGDYSTSSIKVNEEVKGSMIYVVEDNTEMRVLISSLLSPFFVVKEFSNGAECCDEIQNIWPDLIISDVMMPQMNGFELCHSIKSDMKTSHIPIILLTACYTVDDKIKGLEYGADAYIPKPFYPKHVVTRVETLLQNRKLLRERFKINLPITNQTQGGGSVAKDNEFLGNVYTLFAKHLDNEDIDIETIIKEIGINRTHFFQKIKALTDNSPYELFKEYRLGKAAEMLSEGNKQVSEVCDLTGFKSRTHFTKLFKDKYGVTPSKYSQH